MGSCGSIGAGEGRPYLGRFSLMREGPIRWISMPSRWIEMWWWNQQTVIRSLGSVRPPCDQKVTWWTSSR